MKTLFFGTPALAVPFLEKLQALTEVAGIVTNPDQPAGRGYEVQASPVKAAAQRLERPLFQPEKAGDPAFLEAVRALAPDLGLVVAYGKLLPPALLSIPRLGFLNVHFSLLPAYRGAAPIQWALINGETETGVTLFWLDEGMDTGPVFLQKRIPVDPRDDAESLRGKLVAPGLQALEEAVALLEAGRRAAMPQQGTPSRAPVLRKEDGVIGWNKTASEIVNWVRGLTPWPGAWTSIQRGGRAQRLKLLQVEAVSDEADAAEGEIVRLDGREGFVIKCGRQLLKVRQVQPEGRKAMSAWDFWQGARLNIGDRLG